MGMCPGQGLSGVGDFAFISCFYFIYFRIVFFFFFHEIGLGMKYGDVPGVGVVWGGFLFHSFYLFLFF